MVLTDPTWAGALSAVHSGGLQFTPAMGATPGLWGPAQPPLYSRHTGGRRPPRGASLGLTSLFATVWPGSQSLPEWPPPRSTPGHPAGSGGRHSTAPRPPDTKPVLPGPPHGVCRAPARPQPRILMPPGEGTAVPAAPTWDLVTCLGRPSSFMPTSFRSPGVHLQWEQALWVLLCHLTATGLSPSSTLPLGHLASVSPLGSPCCRPQRGSQNTYLTTATSFSMAHSLGTQPRDLKVTQSPDTKVLSANTPRTPATPHRHHMGMCTCTNLHTR